jgi:hypothetical protein
VLEFAFMKQREVEMHGEKEFCPVSQKWAAAVFLRQKNAVQIFNLT